jgi:hypothetical protein
MFKRYFMVLFVLLGVAVLGSSVEALVQDGLVAYWSFDAGDTSDLIGGREITVVGAPETVEGAVGDALKFAGAESVSFSSEGFPTGNVSVTWSAWVQREVSSGSVEYIASYGLWDCCGQAFGVGTRMGDEENTVFMTQWGGGFDAFATAISLGEWHHVAAVYDGDLQNSTVYIDGEVAASVDLPESPNYIDTEPAAIGSNPVGAEYFEGLIDEVGLYSRALSADDVQQNIDSEGLTQTAVESVGRLTSTWGSIRALK